MPDRRATSLAACFAVACAREPPPVATHDPTPGASSSVTAPIESASVVVAPTSSASVVVAPSPSASSSSPPPLDASCTHPSDCVWVFTADDCCPKPVPRLGNDAWEASLGAFCKAHPAPKCAPVAVSWASGPLKCVAGHCAP